MAVNNQEKFGVSDSSTERVHPFPQSSLDSLPRREQIPSTLTADEFQDFIQEFLSDHCPIEVKIFIGKELNPRIVDLVSTKRKFDSYLRPYESSVSIIQNREASGCHLYGTLSDGSKLHISVLPLTEDGAEARWRRDRHIHMVERVADLIEESGKHLVFRFPNTDEEIHIDEQSAGSAAEEVDKTLEELVQIAKANYKRTLDQYYFDWEGIFPYTVRIKYPDGTILATMVITESPTSPENSWDQEKTEQDEEDPSEFIARDVAKILERGGELRPTDHTQPIISNEAAFNAAIVKMCETIPESEWQDFNKNYEYQWSTSQENGQFVYAVRACYKYPDPDHIHAPSSFLKFTEVIPEAISRDSIRIQGRRIREVIDAIVTQPVDIAASIARAENSLKGRPLMHIHNQFMNDPSAQDLFQNPPDDVVLQMGKNWKLIIRRNGEGVIYSDESELPGWVQAFKRMLEAYPAYHHLLGNTPHQPDEEAKEEHKPEEVEEPVATPESSEPEATEEVSLPVEIIPETETIMVSEEETSAPFTYGEVAAGFDKARAKWAKRIQFTNQQIARILVEGQKQRFLVTTDAVAKELQTENVTPKGYRLEIHRAGDVYIIDRIPTGVINKKESLPPIYIQIIDRDQRKRFTDKQKAVDEEARIAKLKDQDISTEDGVKTFLLAKFRDEFAKRIGKKLKKEPKTGWKKYIPPSPFPKKEPEIDMVQVYNDVYQEMQTATLKQIDANNSIQRLLTDWGVPTTHDLSGVDQADLLLRIRKTAEKQLTLVYLEAARKEATAKIMKSLRKPLNQEEIQAIANQLPDATRKRFEHALGVDMLGKVVAAKDRIPGVKYENATAAYVWNFAVSNISEIAGFDKMSLVDPDLSRVDANLQIFRDAVYGVDPGRLEQELQAFERDLTRVLAQRPDALETIANIMSVHDLLLGLDQTDNNVQNGPALLRQAATTTSAERTIKRLPEIDLRLLDLDNLDNAHARAQFLEEEIALHCTLEDLEAYLKTLSKNQATALEVALENQSAASTLTMFSSFGNTPDVAWTNAAKELAQTRYEEKVRMSTEILERLRNTLSTALKYTLTPEDVLAFVDGVQKVIRQRLASDKIQEELSKIEGKMKEVNQPLQPAPTELPDWKKAAIQKAEAALHPPETAFPTNLQSIIPTGYPQLPS